MLLSYEVHIPKPLKKQCLIFTYKSLERAVFVTFTEMRRPT